MIQFERPISNDDCMAGIVATLESGHPTDFTSQLINHLSFTLVTPLRPEHDRGRHDGGALQTLHELAHSVNGFSQPILTQLRDDFKSKKRHVILRSVEMFKGADNFG
jgi:hypothetical protein